MTTSGAVMTMTAIRMVTLVGMFGTRIMGNLGSSLVDKCYEIIRSD